jgi:hypothetical protein
MASGFGIISHTQVLSMLPTGIRDVEGEEGEMPARKTLTYQRTQSQGMVLVPERQKANGVRVINVWLVAQSEPDVVR